MRRVGYGVAGLIIGIVVYLLLLTNMPSAITVKANRNDFVEKEDVSDYIPDEDYYKGGDIVPFLEYGSYHVSATDLVGYEKAGVIKYGKLDPTYFSKQEKTAEGDDVISDTGDSNAPKEHKNALDTAKRYFSTLNFSRKGIEEQLKFEGFTEEAINYALSNIVVDYNKQALGSARSYDNVLSMSSKRLLEQLIHDGYTEAQAKYAVDNLNNKDISTDKVNKVDKENKDNTDGHKVTDGKGSGSLGKEMQKGFDIHSRTEKDGDISGIRKAFKDNAVMPIDEKYYNISSKYGRRVDPFENVNAYHVGLDIASEGINGQNIYSVLDGEVVAAGFDDAGYGNYIIIEHDGFETLYAHMKSETLLKVGDRVKSGDVIGYIGSTGRSTGPHLHFEVGIGGLKFNPEIFIKEIRKGE